MYYNIFFLISIIMSYQKHLKLDHNTTGHDYIVGDLHGAYDTLIEMLNLIQFDKNNDRLFSVGDIIDRGPKSIELINLLNEPWFFMTLGNHEHMMINSIIFDHKSYTDCWLNNGGDWSLQIPKHKLTELANKLSTQPLIISVGNDINRFNICHAELISYDQFGTIQQIDDNFIDNWLFTTQQEYDILWSREIIDNHNIHNQYSSLKTKFHNNLSLTFVGHTIPLNFQSIQLQQHFYLDTGCSMQSKSFETSSKFKLSIASPTKSILYQMNPKTLHLSEIPLSEIQKF